MSRCAPSPMPRPELGRGLPRGGTERPREGAVVVESGSQGHFGNGEIRLGQHLRGRRKTRLCDQLAGRDPEDALDQPCETYRCQTRTFCQSSGRNRLGVLSLEILQCRRQGSRNHLAVTRRPQIARNPHQPQDLSFPVPPGQLRGQTPTWSTAWIPVELQPIADRVSGADHVRVLRRITCREGSRKELAHAAPEKFARLPKPHPLGQGPVHGDIPSREILHEEGRVRNMIKQRRQTRCFGRQRRDRSQMTPAFSCASFH